MKKDTMPKYKKRKMTAIAVRNAKNGYMFLLPFLLGFILFLVVPLFTSLRMSFSEVGFSLDGFTMTSVGLANYTRAFTVDPEFNRFFVAELTKIGTRVPFIIVMSFFTALILQNKFKFRGLARAIFFLPVILTSGVIVGIETNNSLMNNLRGIMQESSNVGYITDVLEDLLLGGIARYSAVQFVLSAVNGIYDILMSCGIQILIFLAGLQAVPASLYEAAKIDGATGWECFWKVTLPMVSSLIVVATVYSIIDTCVRTDSELFTRIRQQMVVSMNYGYASAMAWIYFVSIMVIIVVVVGILSKVVFYDE